MTNQEIFFKAHQIARETKTVAGSYRIAFACALRAIYSELKGAAEQATEQTTAQKLEALGIEAWERGEMKRYYINDDMFAAVFALEIERYKSGNIFSAALNGECISNTKCRKLISGKKFYYDAVKGEWFEKGFFGVVPLCGELANSLQV